MPRIDPQQLLSCLGVLLNPSGGIRSKDEVIRLAGLMTKYSKNLVSKCVYILILKNTDTELLGRFMEAGGWNLTHLWLTNGIINKNWALVAELLELMLMCPVDVERLKANNCPKLVKGLSKEGGPEGVRILATKLVEQWLKVVKGETQGHTAPAVSHSVPVNTENSTQPEVKMVQAFDSQVAPEATIPSATKSSTSESEVTNNVPSVPTPVYRISVRDGKQVIAKIEDTVSKSPKRESEEVIVPDIVKDDKEKSSSKDKSKHHSSSKHSSSKSSSSSRSSSSSSHKDKSRSHHSSSSSRDKDHKKSSSSSSHRDKDKDKERSKHRESGKSSSDHKENQAEKDKATLAKLIPQSISKLGKIPKKSDKDSKSDKSDHKKDKKPVAPAPKVEVKKPSISIEDRKSTGDRPKTVKIFNGKMRSTGLEEEAKPPPPRPVPKKVGSTPSIKRPSPPKDYFKDVISHPPEKRPKIADLVKDDDEEKQSRPGGIKLIAPKPKPIGLQECGLFMDAMVAASTKKDPKKRKRRLSSSKDDGPLPAKTSSPPSSPIDKPAEPTKKPEPTSPHVLRPTAPKFYKDTLESDDDSDSKEDDKPLKVIQKEEIAKNEADKTEKKEVKEEEKEEKPVEPEMKFENKIPGGVLVYHKRKGPKKSVKWRTDADLEQVQYFELDETERVNVTKTFNDMKHQDLCGERDAFQLSRKLATEDLMDERTRWRPMIPIDLTPDLAVLGNKSKEKDIQYAREKVILQALYFHKSMIPDSPTEPDVEHHAMEDPVIIPLDDIAGNPDNVKDFTSTPFPESKGEAPRIVPPVIPMQQFPNPSFMPIPAPGPPGPFPVPFGPPNGANFMGPDVPPMMNGDWRTGDRMMGMPNGPNDMPMGPPNMFPMGGPMGPPNMFPGPPDGFNMGPNMNGPPFPGPMDFGPNGPPMFNDNNGPPPGDFHNNNRRGNNGPPRGRGGRGNFDRFNNGPPNNWKGGNNRNWGNRSICKHFEKSGYCRQGEKCQFLHPGVNCPPF